MLKRFVLAMFVIFSLTATHALAQWITEDHSLLSKTKFVGVIIEPLPRQFKPNFVHRRWPQPGLTQVPTQVRRVKLPKSAAMPSTADILPDHLVPLDDKEAKKFFEKGSSGICIPEVAK